MTPAKERKEAKPPGDRGSTGMVTGADEPANQRRLR